MKTTLLLSLTTLTGVLLCACTVSAQAPPATNPQPPAINPAGTPLPPRHPGPLYYVPGQIYPFDPATGQPVLPPALQAQIDKRRHGGALAGQGDAEAAKGNWAQAASDYRQALDFAPDDDVALYGLGDYAVSKGYTQAALGYYRQAIYTHPDPPALPQFHESNPYSLMEYALLLSQTGQQEEALTVYRRGAQLLNAQIVNLMPLPDFGDGPGQISFTPQRLQAMAQVGWAYDHSDFDRAGAGARLQQAVVLWPDSPAPYFYRARHEARYGIDYEAAGADFDKAARLADADGADATQQERHLFQYRIDAATQAAQAMKTTP